MYKICHFLFIMLGLLLSGCGPDFGQDCCLKLKAGMTMEDVDKIFSDHRVGKPEIAEKGKKVRIYSGQLFQADVPAYLIILYAPSSVADWRRCEVYFDKNKIIIGYDYSPFG